MPIALPKDTQAFLVGSLKRYAREELDLELGDLQAKLFLAYVLTEIGPSVYNQAIACGATAEMEIQDIFWGDRYGQVKDPFTT